MRNLFSSLYKGDSTRFIMKNLFSSVLYKGESRRLIMRNHLLYYTRVDQLMKEIIKRQYAMRQSDRTIIRPQSQRKQQQITPGGLGVGEKNVQKQFDQHNIVICAPPPPKNTNTSRPWTLKTDILKWKLFWCFDK